MDSGSFHSHQSCMKIIVDFFLLALIVSLQQEVSATETCSVASDGTVTTLTGALKNVELSSKQVRVFEVIDEENPTCYLLVKARTRGNSNGEISRVAVSLVGDMFGRPTTVYQFDLKTQNVIMRGQGFNNPDKIDNYPHTWNETGITVIEREGGWILSHSACGYEITVAEMEDRVLDIKVPGRILLRYAVGPCALSDDCDVEFVNLPSSTDTGFEIDPSAFKLIGVCKGRNMYIGRDMDPDTDFDTLYLFPLVSSDNLRHLFMVGQTPCLNWGFMYSRTLNANPEDALEWRLWIEGVDPPWVTYPDVSAQCTTVQK